MENPLNNDDSVFVLNNDQPTYAERETLNFHKKKTAHKVSEGRMKMEYKFAENID